MYKINIKLKQISPLIHFQSHQEGATLRATDIKPKLDRYLSEVLKNQDLYSKLHKRKDQSDSLSYSYKIKIKHSEPRSIELSKQNSYSCFFGNTGVHDVDRLKQLLFYPSGIELVLSSDYVELIQAIILHIENFFIKTHFGNRTSKGFGYFLIHSIQTDGLERKMQLTTGEFEQKLKLLYQGILIFKKEIYGKWTSDPAKYETLFKEIDKLNKTLKAGMASLKVESKLRQYFLSRIPPIEWEKPMIQKMVMESSGTTLKVHQQVSNIKFVRALLGLPGQFEYDKLKKTVSVSHMDEQEKIERFRSPIDFKIYGNCIYLIAAHTIPEKLYHATFKFKINDVRIASKNLKTPSKDEFNLPEFLIKAMNNEKHWTRIN